MTPDEKRSDQVNELAKEANRILGIINGVGYPSQISRLQEALRAVHDAAIEKAAGVVDLEPGSSRRLTNKIRALKSKGE